jgi:hypothetical protein
LYSTGATPLEEVELARRPLGRLEGVVLLDLDHHRQPPALGAQRVARAGEGLLLGEQLLASDQPVVLARTDLAQRSSVVGRR